MALVNHVTVPRPRPEVGLGEWVTVPAGAGVAVADRGPDDVRGMMRVLGADEAVTAALNLVPIAVTDETVYVTAQVRSSVALSLVAQVSGGDSSDPVALPADEWVEVSLDHFVTGSASDVTVYLATHDGTDPVELPDGETLEFTMGYVSTDEAPLISGFHYFDGGTPDDLDENGRGWVHEWTGGQWGSTSTRRYGFAGVLTATWNPDLAGVHLIVDGGMWPSEVAQLRIERSTAGDPTVPVRGVEKIWAPGGGYVGTDHEMPINTLVEYTVYGYDKNGDLVDEANAVVKTTAQECDFFIKAPGNADLTQNLTLRQVDAMESTTRGGAYQIAGGGALGQSAGSDTRKVSITVRTHSPGEAKALEGLLSAARTLLMQHGATSPEIPDGWWWVASWSRTNVAQKDFSIWPKRDYSFDLTATEVPAGVGVRTTGTTWGALMAKCETWQDVLDTYPTWLDVVLGDEGGTA